MALDAATVHRGAQRPEVVVLTPGVYNSAYFEHAYLAQQMGCELVEGRDLVVRDDDCVYMRTIEGLARVDVIYRRIDDLFLDPEAFRKYSTLGVPGLMRAWKHGHVALANAPGAGVADDKVVYAYVPDMIRFYLDEEPILPQVETYVCAREDDCRYVLEHLDELVVKPVNEAGGYGMLMGPSASQRDRQRFAEQIEADPRNYIAQPRIELSSCPTWTSKGVEPRRVDLRPFIVTGDSTWVLPGGLTRVALRKGELDTLAELGALGSIDPAARTRRSALWQVAALERDPGSLFAGKPPEACPSPLAELSPLETTLADYRRSGLTIGPHVMEHLRGGLRRRGCLSAAELRDTPDGRPVRTAGFVVVRQRPGSAKGFCFLTLEDETGTSNAVLTPRGFRRFRIPLHTSSIVEIAGPLQNVDGVIHVRVRELVPLAPREQLPDSHDYR